eukprot:2832859-Rhodomonas_salina.2
MECENMRIGGPAQRRLPKWAVSSYGCFTTATSAGNNVPIAPSQTVTNPLSDENTSAGQHQ